jgi:hypothetical protein
MKQDTRPLYQPPPQHEPLRYLGPILSGVLLAWLMVALYGAAFALHWAVEGLL